MQTLIFLELKSIKKYRYLIKIIKKISITTVGHIDMFRLAIIKVILRLLVFLLFN